MYLSNIKLWNFRKFGSEREFVPEQPNLNLNLTPGLNVLIGENDSGKSAIIDAIKLVLKTHSYEFIKVEKDDFYLNSNRFRIELQFDDFSDDEAKNFTEWLGWIGTGENAKPFLRVIYDVNRRNDRIIPSDVRAGVDEEGYPLTAEARDYLKTTYLKPLRDAESELVAKKNSRLSQVLLGDATFKDKNKEHELVTIFKGVNKKLIEYFNEKPEPSDVIETESDKKQKVREGKLIKDKIDELIKNFFGKNFETEFKVTDDQIKSILEKLDIGLKDIFNPGLGTLNRLFIATELLHLSRDDWFGLRLGLIEELEAHLHPQVQMKVIEALQGLTRGQLILTTHSPNLASKVKLKNLIICNANNAFPMAENYTMLDPSDYKFLEKFLDVTRSNLFFAKGVILVEGWSEEILLPSLAKKIGVDLNQQEVSVINVGNTAMLRYAKIFQRAYSKDFNGNIITIEKQDDQYKIYSFEKKNSDSKNKKEISENEIYNEHQKDFIKWAKKNLCEMSIPVSIITDIDIPEYEKMEGLIQKKTTGKNEVDERIDTLKKQYNNQKVKVFISPYWTFEYCLFKSKSLSKLFIEIVKEVHSGSKKEWNSNFEITLAKNLINRTLKKSEIAYRMAQRIEEDKTPSINNDINDNNDTINYLIKAIKYACGNEN